MGIKKIPFFDFSAVLDKLQAIADNVHPTASGTSITPTGMHIVTEDDVQGAISELDSAVDSVSSNLAQLESDINVTAKTNITLMRSTSYRVGALVGCTLDFKLTASANTWIDIGDIDYLPTNMAQVPCVNTSNGTFGGLIQLTTGGVIRLYPPTAINNSEISFTINYKCVLS